MATQSKTKKTQPENNQETPPMMSFSASDLRSQVILDQAQKDAYQDAKTYIQAYDLHFESLKAKGLLNLLEHKVNQHSQQLEERESQSFFMHNQEELTQKMMGLKLRLTSHSVSQSKFLPSQIGS